METEIEKKISEDITEYVKLIRNSKGYTWEIRVNGIDLDKIEKINERMLASYGPTA